MPMGSYSQTKYRIMVKELYRVNEDVAAAMRTVNSDLDGASAEHIDDYDAANSDKVSLQLSYAPSEGFYQLL